MTGETPEICSDKRKPREEKEESEEREEREEREGREHANYMNFEYIFTNFNVRKKTHSAGRCMVLGCIVWMYL